MSTPPRRNRPERHRLNEHMNPAFAREQAMLARMQERELNEPGVEPKYNEFGNRIPQREEYEPRLGETAVLFNERGYVPERLYREAKNAYRRTRAEKQRQRSLHILANTASRAAPLASSRKRKNRKTRRSKN